MKQTAVEWLEKELNLIEENKYTSYIELKIQQAKAMEKEQIIDAFKQGIEYWNGDEWKLIDVNYYYKKTYESNT